MLTSPIRFAAPLKLMVLPGRKPTKDEADKFDIRYPEDNFVAPLEKGKTAKKLLDDADTPYGDFLNTFKRVINHKVVAIGDKDVLKRYKAAYQLYEKAASGLLTSGNSYLQSLIAKK